MKRSSHPFAVVVVVALGACVYGAAPELNPASTISVSSIMKVRRDFWSFRRPAEQLLPTVKNVEIARTPIDRFVLARLEAQGLTLSPQADRRTLIRRASYDLLGLPPTMDEVEAFVADPAPDAYEKLIDRLLASPHYGERWGRYWLDLARYSDTKGYVYAREEKEFVHAHNYRDWVISALNEDMPYDRFIMLQIAA
ncbi:MAG TPA: DUF1549 domain-containing protein, partial [Humisphaera sp.]|nr:DUF1549 domain-containing protein [Humisphaera sp.]